MRREERREAEPIRAREGWEEEERGRKERAAERRAGATADIYRGA